MWDYCGVPERETLVAEKSELAERVRVCVAVSVIIDAMGMTLHHVFLQVQHSFVRPASKESASIVIQELSPILLFRRHPLCCFCGPLCCFCVPLC